MSAPDQSGVRETARVETTYLPGHEPGSLVLPAHLAMSDWRSDAAAEIVRAREMHGSKSMHAASPLAEKRIRILLEEVGEVAKEFNDAEVEDRAIDTGKLRAELIQVVALAGGWVQSLDLAFRPERSS